jgi:acetyltransferase-like isoleucine patch superfamily enzyme
MNAPDPQVPGPGEGGNPGSLRARLADAWRVEFSNLRFRLLFWTLLAGLLPVGRANALRTAFIRAMGVRIGPDTVFLAMPKIQSQNPGPLGLRLAIGARCSVGARVILEFGEKLTIGDRVSLADGVVILTTTHELGPRERRAGAVVRSPVVIGNDVEIGVDAIILPGANIGDGARVLHNSVVNGTVAPGETVSGIPARPLRQSQQESGAR